MTWLDSLEVPITEALKQFPNQVNVASVVTHQQTFLVSREALQDMERMQLGHLPLSAIALPYELSDILTRPQEENLIRDFSHHLSDFFPNFFVAAIYELQSLLNLQNLNAYIIGGITRDMLLSSEKRYEIQDVDIIVEGKAIEAAHDIDEKSKNFSLIQEFTPFGTAKLNYREQVHIDLASTRKEIYLGCGLLPEVVELGVPLEEDIIRRDFTVNALALSITKPGQVIDCLGGLKDLEARTIRLLKPASFFEDPSRIIRAVKFAMRLEFTWSEDTVLLLDQFLTWMPAVYKGGGDRIREELYKMLCHPESDLKIQWLHFFIEKGLFRLIDTQIPNKLALPVSLEEISGRVEILKAHLSEFWNDDLTWQIYISFLMMGIPEQSVESAMHRLGLTRSEIEVVEKSFRLLHENILYPLTPFDNVAKLYEMFHPLPLGTACVGIILSSQFETCLEALVKYKHELEQITLEVTGDDIIKLGIPQSEQIGKLLKALLHAKLQGKVHHRLDEISWLKEYITNSLEESHS